MSELHDVLTRDPEHVERLAVALVREEVWFDVRPEPDGWWLIRVTLVPGRFWKLDLDAVAQSTRRPAVLT